MMVNHQFWQIARLLAIAALPSSELELQKEWEQSRHVAHANPCRNRCAVR